jgi:predicted phage-related endonuclease
MDFNPEIRRQAIWATDARKIVAGKSDEVYAEKVGLMERPDLTNNEAAQWGIKLQEAIGREVGARLRLNLKDADYALTHKTYPWMRSHFDFISEDNNTLVEVKNYNSSKRNRFDGCMMPAEDRAQCIHEAAVHGVNRVILAVLFGGQELHISDLLVSETEKDDLIRTESAVWAAVQTQTPPNASSPELARVLHPNSNLGVVIADAQLEQMCAALKSIKTNISALEQKEKEYTAAIQSQMKSIGTLATVDGRILATWHKAKSSTTFDRELFQKTNPSLYQSYITEIPGTRRFLVK